eukprot:3255439-Pyramimonas_sp.AAC.1
MDVDAPQVHAPPLASYVRGSLRRPPPGGRGARAYASMGARVAFGVVAVAAAGLLRVCARVASNGWHLTRSARRLVRALTIKYRVSGASPSLPATMYLNIGQAAGGRSSQLPSAGPCALLTTPAGVPFSSRGLGG